MDERVSFNWKKAVTVTAIVLGLGMTLVMGIAGETSAREATPAEWDGMKRVERAGLDAVYLREGVSLAKYKKVMLDPVEVSFDKNWDPKRTGSLVSGNNRVDTQRIRTDLAELARHVTQRELERKNGFPLVDDVGEDVLRIRAQIVDLYINAPDTMSPGERSYVVSAGEMTLVADLYDSATNALIGHVIDRRRGMENGPYDFQIANRVTNTAEADRILSLWARRLRSALENAR